MASPEGVSTIDETSRNFERIRTPIVPGGSMGIRSKLQEAFDSRQLAPRTITVPVSTEDPEQPNDTQLFLAWQQGDQSSLAQLEHLYAQQALNVAFRYLEDRQKAEDAVQEAWIRILNSKTFDEEKRFGPYFMRTVANLCVDILRKQKTAPVREYSLNNSGDFDREPIKLLADTRGTAAPTEFEEAAHDILNGMPEKYRQVVMLRAEGYTNGAIAVKIGREEETVRWRLATAQEGARLAARQRGFHLRH